MTVPELKKECENRDLDGKGKKMELIMRLVIWVRDRVKDAEGNQITSSNDDKQLICKDKNNTINDDADEEIVQADGADQKLALTKQFTSINEKLPNDDDDENQSIQSCSTSSEEELCIISSNIKVSQNPTKQELQNLLFQFYGYTTFRYGQEWAIQRCIAGKRSLLVAPTAMGKSLCYALPAAIMSGLTLVVSPLLSLIQDQLRIIPPNIPAATLSSLNTQSEIMTIFDDIRQNRIKILFLSPERLTSLSFKRFIQNEIVSLLCIDEVHCLSQWGHHFRPSYLRIKCMISTIIKPKSILALTATASPKVIKDVCCVLNIEDDRVDVPSSFDIELYEEIDMGDDKGVLVLSAHRDNIDTRAFLIDKEDDRRNLVSYYSFGINIYFVLISCIFFSFIEFFRTLTNHQITMPNHQDPPI